MNQNKSKIPKQVEDNFSGGMIFLWSVLQCNMCNHNWDRDYNAATNILNLGMREQLGLDRPQVFTRPVPAPPPPSEDDDASSGNPIDVDVTPSQELNTGFLGLNL